MSEFIEIQVLIEHSILGAIRSEGDLCLIHEGVAQDLIERRIAKLKNEGSIEAGEGGE